MPGNTDDGEGDASRRLVLRSLGVAGATLGPGGALAGRARVGIGADRPTQRDGNASNASNATIGVGGAGRTTIVLGGETDGWLGLAPDAIEGTRNPRLPLATGTRYEVVWVNLDGRRHQFVLADAGGAMVAATNPAGATGRTRSVAFEATPDLAAYRCRFHPGTMRGEVSVAAQQGGDRTAGNESAGNETAGDRTDGDATGGNETAGNETAGNETAGAGGGEVAEVTVGPEGRYFDFVPAEVEIPVGGTVRWTAESVGHNVSCRPEASSVVSLPAGAEPFASYPEGESYRIIDVGTTYEHAFATPGEYTYVCVPHVSEGMVGTVRVTG